MSFFKLQTPIPPVKVFTTFGPAAKMLLISDPADLPQLYDSNGVDISGNPIGRAKWVGLPIARFFEMFFRVRTWKMRVSGFSAAAEATFQYTSESYEQTSSVSEGSMDGTSGGFLDDPEHMMVVRLSRGSVASSYQDINAPYSMIFPNGSHVHNIRTLIDVFISVGFGLHGWLNSTGTLLNFVYFHKASGKVYFPLHLQVRAKIIA